MLRSTVLTFALLAPATVPGGIPGGVPAARSPPPTVPSAVTVVDLPPAQEALLGWALGQFAAAELPLPPLVVIGHRSTSPCRGRDGAHRFEGGRSEIHLCTREATPAQELLLLHEIAHAWDRHALDDDRRRAFLELRGLDDWRNDDPERWAERGAEHAAEIVTWGLMDRPVAVIRIRPNGCADLRAGYVTLVGRPPLHGHTDRCGP